ncbi:MAG: Gfo/Idh/MocA family oxidoreductase [Bdellovibrionota bacterium]
MNFAIIGVGGYIAPRHLEAIKDLGHQVTVAYDCNDSVGILDRYFPKCQFYTKYEEFQKNVLALRGTTGQIEFVSVCTPNFLHAEHIKFGLSAGANVICEKPLVLTEKDLDEIQEFEKRYDRKAYSVLQLRLHDSISALREKIRAGDSKRHVVDLTYITSRGHWYQASWKGDVAKSGGLATNIGVHFFDMLTWIFGEASEVTSIESSSTVERGFLRLEKADVNWFLTIDSSYLPKEAAAAGKTTFRSIRIDSTEFEFSEGFTELHKKVYSDVLAGKGYGVEANRSTTRIVEQIRKQ